MVLSVSWCCLPPTWIKININETANGCPSPVCEAKIFKNCRDFIKSCFSIHLGITYAFDVKLLVIMHAIQLAESFNQIAIWLE